MLTFGSVVRHTVILSFLAGCADDGPGPVPPPPVPVPVGLMWGSGASGAMVEDTVELIVFYRDSANDPIGAPRPRVTWSSSNSSVLEILSDSLAVARDIGPATLTAITATAPFDTLEVAFEVIPRWHGRLVWARQPQAGVQPGMAFQEFPEHEVHQLPDLGHPGAGSGDPYLSVDGRRLAAMASRPGSSLADRTVYIVDLVTGVKQAPLDSLPGNQFAPVWFRGDTLLAFLMGAPTGWEVFTARLDGSGVQQRTQLGQATPPFFDLTPDGNLVLALSTGQAWDLFEVTLGSDTVRRLTSTTDYTEIFPATSPDGTMIAYVATRNGDSFSHVWVMNRDGSNRRRLLPDRKKLSGLAPAFSSNLSTTHDPSWSPDGQFVLVARYLDPYLSADGQLYQIRGEIYAIRLADSLAIRLTRSTHIDRQPFFR